MTPPAPDSAPLASPRRPHLSPWLLIGWALMLAGLWAALHLHLLPALLAGLLVHELVQLLAPRLAPRRPGGGQLVALALLAAAIIALLVPLVMLGVAWLARTAGDLPALEAKVQAVLWHARQQLPAFTHDYLPNDPAALAASLREWLTAHVHDLRVVGGTAVTTVVHLVIGMILGGLMSLHTGRRQPIAAPLARTLSVRAGHLALTFRQVVFAQVQIALINATLTGIFLLVVLPLAGVHLPFAKTLVVFTFVVGLLPVVGNLVSNTVLTMVALAVSLNVAIAALVFLIIIHKLEYFLNARIIGGRVHASTWELLGAMVLMEAAFGLGGLVAAPIYYAYIKRELSLARLV